MTGPYWIPFIIAAGAWLIGKSWEISDRRRQRYTEVVARISSLNNSTGNAENRQQLLDEISKLWIDAPRNVVVAAERALDAVQEIDPNADLLLRELIVNMRQETRFWRSFIAGHELRRLRATDIKLRQANK